MSKRRQRYNEQLRRQTCEYQLRKIDFIGGTFVSYCRNGEELRGTISRFNVKNNTFSIHTLESDSCVDEFKLGCPQLHSSNCSIQKQGDIWYINMPYLGTCAIAPEGAIWPTDEVKL